MNMQLFHELVFIRNMASTDLTDTGYVSIILRFAAAFILGSITGWERAHNRHAAGMRTFILVMVISASSAMLDQFIRIRSGENFPIITASTIIGIATISTYSIFYTSKSTIRGLTTAVALWGMCIIGAMIGNGYYAAGLIAYVTYMICLVCLSPVEFYLRNRSNHFEIHLELTDKKKLQDFVTTSRKLGMRIDDIELNQAYINSGLSVYSISLTIIGQELKQYKSHNEIIEALQTLDYVHYIEELL